MTCKPSTLDDYRQMVGRLNLVFGTLPVESITRQDLERWKADTSTARPIEMTVTPPLKKFVDPLPSTPF